MKRLFVLLLVLLVSLPLLASSRGDAADAQKKLRQSAEVLDQIMAAPDKGIPAEVLENAKCIAVVPKLLKAGFIFGGKHGEGVATCRTASGWSAPAFLQINGGSWGLQIGAESVALVLLVMNDAGVQALLSSKFKIGTDASAAAGPVGRHASAGTDWKLDTQILAYSRAKGLFAGLTLEGAGVTVDDADMNAFYPRKVSFKEVLTGKVAAPAGASVFLNAVHSAYTKAKASD